MFDAKQNIALYDYYKIKSGILSIHTLRRFKLWSINNKYIAMKIKWK